MIFSTVGFLINNTNIRNERLKDKKIKVTLQTLSGSNFKPTLGLLFQMGNLWFVLRSSHPGVLKCTVVVVVHNTPKK